MTSAPLIAATHVWWDTARAAGIVAWALASLAVISGLQQSTRLTQRPRPAWTLDVHRFVAGLAVVFVGVHLVGLLLDPFINYGLLEILVPFSSSYKPAAVALGVVALYLIVAVELTSLLMKKMSRSTWHAIHLSSYALFVFATAHGITSGTDRHNAVLQWACLLTAALVLFMTLVRVLAPRRTAAPRSRTGQP